jgi:hypothetical protein
MRKISLTLATAAACALGVSLAQPASAGALAGAETLRTAGDALSLVETVHCTPGRVHRRSWPYDGCRARVYRAPVYRAPYVYGGYSYYGGYPYGYAPGISFGFGYGPRWGIGFGW